MSVMAQVHQTRRSSAAGFGEPMGMDLLNESRSKDTFLVEGNIKVTQVLPREERPKEIAEKCHTMCLRFSQDGGVLAVGQADGVIKIYNPDTGQCLHSLSDDDTSRSHLPVTSLRFKPYQDHFKVEHKNILMATYASGLMKFWHYTSGSCIHTEKEDRQILSSAFNPSGTRLVTCGNFPQLYLYDTATQQKLRTLEASDSRDVMNGHKARVYAVQYHPTQPNVFLTGGWDDTVQFWDDRQPHSFRKIFGPHICGDSLDIDPVHNHIVTGSWRRESVLQIWHFESGDIIKTVPQDPSSTSMLYCAQWLGKENIMCGGCNPNMARIIDRGTLNTVGHVVDLPSGVYCMDNDRQAKPKIAVGADSRVFILKMEKRQ